MRTCGVAPRESADSEGDYTLLLIVYMTAVKVPASEELTVCYTPSRNDTCYKRNYEFGLYPEGSAMGDADVLSSLMKFCQGQGVHMEDIAHTYGAVCSTDQILSQGPQEASV